MATKELHLAHTKGFCAGVVNAIDIVERCLKKYGTPLYVRHAIVHNTSVIRDFESRGVIFIEDIADVPADHVVVFSAHGTEPAVYKQAQERHIQVIDATCPLVTKVHRQALRYTARGVHVVLIGHRGHQELIGTAGHIRPELLHIVEDAADIDALTIPASTEIAVLTQTTLSLDDTSGLIHQLQKKYPHIITGKKEDICYATQNRQNAVKELAKICDMIIVIGSPNSSNSNRLVETAKHSGTASFIVDLPEDIDFKRLTPFDRIGVTSGASVPHILVDQLITRLIQYFPGINVFEYPSVENDIAFPLPPAVRDVSL
jgi:4-hydroxy-3-methylbut-2-enyl diphosphate reductase